MRVADVAGRARADGAVVLRVALRVHAALVDSAGHLAAPLHAAVRVAAVRIHAALRLRGGCGSKRQAGYIAGHSAGVGWVREMSLCLPMGLQRPSLEAMVSGGQTHTTVRRGSVSSTRHSCAGEHTADTAHGFWQRFCRHDR